ncbi:hypothetical protein CDEF62S_04668 [Castellaniella defragrans]
MYDDLFPRERTLSLSQSTQRPYEPPEVGTFTGFGSALADSIPYAGLTAASAWGAILDAYGKAQGFASAATDPGILVGAKPAPDMGAVKAQTIDRMGDSEIARGFRDRARDYAPDPAEVGTAGQIVHGVAASLAKAGLYSLTGPAAPVLFGADVGINRAQELTDQGVDGGTAALAGLASGVAGGVGMRLPAALGATRLQSAGIGAVINPVLNIAEVGGIRALLDHADYGEIAAQYQPFDPLTLAVSSLTGAAFGAAFHAKAGGVKPTLTPDEHAAALTMNEVKTREGDTLARADIQAANSAADAQARARTQLDAGEPVTVAERVEADPQQVQAARRRVVDSPVDESPEAVRPGETVGEAVARGMDGAVDVLPLAGREVQGGPVQAAAAPTGTGEGLPQAMPTGSPVDTPAAQLQALADGAAAPGLVRQVVEAVGALFGRQAEAAPARRADTPEQAQAFEIAARNPDAVIRMDDGSDVRMADLLARADDIQATAKTESAAFDAAVSCALRFPQ